MLLDSQARFSVAQAITAAAISADVIDLGATTTGGAGTPANAVQSAGTGEALTIALNVTTTFTGAATSLTVSLESATDAGLTAGVVVHQSVTVPASALTAGTQALLFSVPAGNYSRFIGLRYTPNGGSFTTGALSAGFRSDVQANRRYATNFIAI